MDRQERIITEVYGERRSQISEKVRDELGLQDDDYIVWFNDHAGRLSIQKVRI